jgi:hypothetical protein
MLRAVNETNTKCRSKVTHVIRRLSAKCSQAKAKTLFNTVCEMDTSAKPQIGLAKMVVMSALIEDSVKNVADAQRVCESCIDIVTGEAIKVSQAKKKKEDEKESSESEEEIKYDDTVKNYEMKEFLQGIDLIDQEKPNKIVKKSTFE